MSKNYKFLILTLGVLALARYDAVSGGISPAEASSLDPNLYPIEASKKTALAVSGTILSDLGDPMPGVSVLEKGTTNGTTTDADGKYNLTVADENAVLVFSFIGFVTQEVNASGRSTIDLSLVSDLITLNEVVVVGYGTQEKRDVTGATATVTAKEVTKRPLTRVEQALQGTTPGVVVTSNSGQPGAPLSVRIRGANSITGNNNPLYVIDGYLGGNIEGINPNDIESLEILKDASATAIYGSRGSNGVVIITTKSGKKGEPRVNFSTWFSKASIPRQLNIMNAYEFATTVNKQLDLTNPTSTDRFTDQQLADLKANGGTDWQKELQVKPWIQNYQLDLSGGTDAAKYLFSVNYLDQPGLILNQYYKRTTFRTNIDLKVTKKLDVGFKISALFPQTRNSGYQGDLTDPFSEANIWDPTSPIRDPITGQYVKNSKYGSKGFNPVAQASNQYDDNRTTSLTGIATIAYQIYKDLTFTSINSYEIQSNLTQNLRGLETSNGTSRNDYAAATSGRYRSYQNSNFLTYTHKFGEHNLTATALYEQQNRLSEGVTARSTNLSTYSLGYYNLSLGKTQQTSSSYWADALQSFMGRVNYEFKDRYLFTASVRTDGSSHLTEKYSTFPALAVAWKLANEDFMQAVNVFSDLKIRASWGKTGNQAVAPYSTIPQINTGGEYPNYYFNGTTPSVSTPLGAPVSKDLKWETTESYDIGLDAAFLEGRLSVTIDAYKKNITDLLYNYQAPFYLGGGNYARNMGTLENKGLEFSVNAVLVNKGKLRWNSYFTMSFNRNKVVNLAGLDNVQVGNIGSAQSGVSLLRVGRPLGEFYGYKYLGTWKSNEAAEAALYSMKPGDPKYVDVNGDHVYNPSDQMVIGNGTPDFSFGFINDIDYGNFTLSFMFQGSQGNDIYSQTMAYLWGGQGQAYNAVTRDAMNIWTPENENDNPSFSSAKNFINSSRYVYDGSYIKLKNITLGYKFPTAMLSKIRMKSLEIYGGAQNILWITNYPGYDPEVNNSTNAITQGLEMGVIPNPRTYTMGLRVGF